MAKDSEFSAVFHRMGEIGQRRDAQSNKKTSGVRVQVLVGCTTEPYVARM